MNEVNDKATKVTGKAEIGSTVTVKHSNKNIGTAKADSKGTSPSKSARKSRVRIIRLSKRQSRQYRKSSKSNR
ncbi:Ig-like domain-containing protein [Peribacillus frigoritolerans]|nr:Ig-like domain-containing protein [Peribacillus frigoritolerans]